MTDDLDQRVLAELQQHPDGRTAVELADALHVDYRPILDALRRLHAVRRARPSTRLGAWVPTLAEATPGGPPTMKP